MRMPVISFHPTGAETEFVDPQEVTIGPTNWSYLAHDPRHTR
jgi:hypothetical protein